MKVRRSVVSLSFILPHPPEDGKKKKKKKKDGGGRALCTRRRGFHPTFVGCVSLG